MKMLALSIVRAWGTRIARGEKSLEIRSWRPDVLPIEDLLIVENGRRLTQPDEIDPDGLAVAMVRVAEAHPWTPAEAQAACAAYESGWLAWTLERVRPIHQPFRVMAARRLYEVEVAAHLLAGGAH